MGRSETTRKYNPFAFLNPLRFIGALIIVLVHCPQLLPSVFSFPNSLYFYFFWYGRIFVEMFFIISGLLFFYFTFPKLVDEKESYKSFFLKKAIKLYPIAIISTLILFTLSRVGVLSWGVKNVGYLFLNLLFFDLSVFNGPSVNPILWFIPVLILCYIVTCFFTYIISKKGNCFLWLFLIPIVLGFTIFFFTEYGNLPDVLARWSRGLIVFNLGIYLGFFLKHFKNFTSLGKSVTRTISILILAVFFIFNIVFEELRYTMTSLTFTLFSAITLFIPLFILCYDVKPLNNFFSYKIFELMRIISVPIYFFHFIFIYSIPFFTPPILYFISIVAITIAFGIIYLGLEYLFKKLIVSIKKTRNIKYEYDK